MRIDLKLFAVGRQRAGSDSVPILLPDRARVSDLRMAIIEQVPALASLAPSLMISIDAEYAQDEAIIPPDAEIAAIPPVSGGAPLTHHASYP